MRTDGAHLQPAFPELGKTLAAGVWYIDRQVPQPVYVVEPIDSPPVATTLFIHGICEHGARYLQFARHLAGIRIRTILFDLKGHGLDVDEPEPFRAVALAYAETPDPAEREARLASVFGSEEGLLRRAQRDHFLRLRILTMRDHLDQVEALARVARDWHPGPLFLGGHSLGGLLALSASVRRGVFPSLPLDGLILLSPALKPIARPEASFPERILVDLAWSGHMGSRLPLGRWLTSLLSWTRLPIHTVSIQSWITDIPEERSAARLDPLLQGVVPSNYLVSILSLMAKLRRTPLDLRTDIFLAAALEDRIVDADAAIAIGKTVGEKRGDPSDHVFLVRDFPYHELHRSSIRSDLLSRLDSWLRNHIGSIDHEDEPSSFRG